MSLAANFSLVPEGVCLHGCMQCGCMQRSILPTAEGWWMRLHPKPTHPAGPFGWSRSQVMLLSLECSYCRAWQSWKWLRIGSHGRRCTQGAVLVGIAKCPLNSGCVVGRVQTYLLESWGLTGMGGESQYDSRSFWFNPSGRSETNHGRSAGTRRAKQRSFKMAKWQQHAVRKIFSHRKGQY